MSSDTQQRFESLQREFAAYAEHVMTQAPKPKSKSKPKQEFIAALPSYCYRGDCSSSKKGQKTQVR